MLYTCQRCGKVCKSLRGLTQHVSITHNMIASESEHKDMELARSPEQLYPTMGLFNSVAPYSIPPELSELDLDYQYSYPAEPKAMPRKSQSLLKSPLISIESLSQLPFCSTGISVNVNC